MSEDYRKAELIELHDSNVRIHPKNYADAIAGWKEFTSNEVYMVDGEMLDRLVKFFRVRTETIHLESEKSHKRYTEELKDFEFPLIRKLVEDIGYGDTSTPHEGSHEIGELWAKPIGERSLDIRFTSIFGSGPDIESKSVYVSYSGSYTVWWSQE